MKSNKLSQNFPMSIMTMEKWWQNSKANNAFAKGDTAKIFAGASCSSENTGGNAESTEDNSENSTTKKVSNKPCD